MFTTAITTITAGSVRAVSESDLPSADFSAPWMDLFTGIGGWLIATVIAVLVVTGVLGALMWAVGKFSKTGGAQESGLGAILISIVGAIIVGIMATVIVWATDIGPEWMTF